MCMIKSFLRGAASIFGEDKPHHLKKQPRMFQTSGNSLQTEYWTLTSSHIRKHTHPHG